MSSSSSSGGGKSAGSVRASPGGRDDSKTNEFRACINAAALEAGSSVAGFLHACLDARADKATQLVDSKVFGDGLIGVKLVRQKFTLADLVDIFGDADEGEKGRVTVEELADFFQRTISKARALALKLRSAVLKDYKNEAEYRRVFGQAVLDREQFTQFAEDVLKVDINDNDAIGLYALYDMDGNGKVSCDDFVGFLLGITKDAVRALDAGNGDVIVDIKVSSNAKEDTEMLRNGYTQVMPDAASLQSLGAVLSSHGTFGKGQSMWMWRRKQGTCSGRLRPVVDLQINNKSYSSALVLAGYACLAVRVSGQYVWIKRSANEEEDNDGLVDLCVTLGKRKSGTSAGTVSVSPGTGWVRVDGNFAKSMLSSNEASLWLLPLRTRSLDNQLYGSMQSGIAMSEEKRLSELLGICRRAIRHHVPLEEMIRVSKIQFEQENNPTGTAYTLTPAVGGSKDVVMNRAFLRSDRMFDFSVIYHRYDSSGKGRLSQSKFATLLRDTGACLDSSDVPHIYRFFDFNLTGQVSREDYSLIMSLTKSELAAVTDKMRSKLLASCDGSQLPSSSSTAATVANQSNEATAAADRASVVATKATVRTNRVLSEVFRHVNANGDGIISLDEVIDMTSKLELFITEAEAQQLFKEMDTNADGRVEESDFVTFMKRKSEVAAKTAHQVTAAAHEIRVWLRQGLTTSTLGTTVNTEKPWAELKARHERSTGTTFPNFIGPDDLTILVASLGKRMHLSPPSARALALLVAPDKFGRIQQSDLHLFISRPVRSFGELLALLERDVMKPVLDAYKAYQMSIGPDGFGNQSLQDAHAALVKDVVREVHATTAVQSLGGGAGVHDVVAVPQLKAGIEAAMSRLRQFDGTVPNIEEWAALGCLVGAVATGDEAYGVNPQAFVEGICEQCLGAPDSAAASAGSSQAVPLDVICKELQRLIRDEAWAAGKSQRLDYEAAFRLFDSDGSGSITLEEFRLMLVRLQLIDLVPDNQLPALLLMFDPKKKGFIVYDDFLRFVDKNKHLAAEVGSYEVDAVDALDMSASNKPPFAITRNADCDILAWTLWKNCCQAEPADPECVVAELESACTESEMTMRAGTVSIKELWNLLFELKIQGSMSKATFEKGVRFLVGDDKGRETDQTQVDYASLCRYVIRMGRAHKALVEERDASDNKKYKALRAALKRELLHMMHDDSPDGGALSSAGYARRFDKVFRRLDTDGDGKLTPQEFKTGLKRLGIKDEKEWNLRLIGLLFRELDENDDGFLTLSELSRLASEEDLYRGGRPKENRAGGREGAAGWGYTASRGESEFGDGGERDGDVGWRDDRDERGDRDGQRGNADDDEIFGEQRIVNDSLLFAKVHEVLRERVPMSSGFESHTEAVKDAIRRFFFRYDPDNKGFVSEERFRAFLRRSGLQDRLAAAELRRVVESLRRKSKTASGSSVTVDYETLCRKLAAAALDGPSTRAELILKKLQDASAGSAATGRPFMNLCALVDTKFRGFITREELLLTTKMMGCPLSMAELETLRDLLPAGALGADGMVDYREINHLLTNATPRNSNLFDLGPRGFAAPATAAYASGLFTPHTHADRFSQAALGGTANPMRASMARSYGGGGAGLGARAAGGAGGGDLLARVARVLGSSAPLRRVLEAHANEGAAPYLASSGLVPGATLVLALEDCGIPVSAVESMALQQAYGRADDDSVDAAAFCEAVDGGGSGGRPGRGMGDAAVYAGVAARLRELQAEGRNPRDIFEAYDLDRTGAVRSTPLVAQRSFYL